MDNKLEQLFHKEKGEMVNIHMKMPKLFGDLICIFLVTKKRSFYTH